MDRQEDTGIATWDKKKWKTLENMERYLTVGQITGDVPVALSLVLYSLHAKVSKAV